MGKKSSPIIEAYRQKLLRQGKPDWTVKTKTMPEYRRGDVVKTVMSDPMIGHPMPRNKREAAHFAETRRKHLARYGEIGIVQRKDETSWDTVYYVHIAKLNETHRFKVHELTLISRNENVGTSTTR